MYCQIHTHLCIRHGVQTRLVSRSGRLAKLVEEMSKEDDNEESSGYQIQLVDIPGGVEAFELAAKFCYQVKVELTTTNVIVLRCVAEYLEMTNSLEMET